MPVSWDPSQVRVTSGLPLSFLTCPPSLQDFRSLPSFSGPRQRLPLPPLHSLKRIQGPSVVCWELLLPPQEKAEGRAQKAGRHNSLNKSLDTHSLSNCGFINGARPCIFSGFPLYLCWAQPERSTTFSFFPRKNPGLRLCWSVCVCIASDSSILFAFSLSSKWHWEGLCLRATSEEELAIIIIRAAIGWLSVCYARISTRLKLIITGKINELVHHILSRALYTYRLISPATLWSRNPESYAGDEATVVRGVKWLVQNSVHISPSPRPILFPPGLVGVGSWFSLSDLLLSRPESQPKRRQGHSSVPRVAANSSFLSPSSRPILSLSLWQALFLPNMDTEMRRRTGSGCAGSGVSQVTDGL